VQQQSLFDDTPPNFGLVGDSPEIQRVLRTIRKLRTNTSPVLITGESGVGKELIARAVHGVSPLAGAVFLPVNAASLSESLIESELFGHVKGAFTGATYDKKGLVQAANGGTLFLDEIGELGSSVQARLLRLLQEQEIRPVGSTKPIRVKVRVLAATNQDLRTAIDKNSFRRDLYHRLNVIHISVPALRDRKPDIPALAAHFLGKHTRSRVTLSEQVMQQFLDYPWPGNMRELENTILYMLAVASDSVLRVENLPTNLHHGPAGEDLPPLHWESPLPLAEVERRHILEVVKYTRGDLTAAAHILDIGKTTLYRKLKLYAEGRREATARRDLSGKAASA
jgi:transcriptional regulator with PAS, ATPase and Fis domain